MVTLYHSRLGTCSKQVRMCLGEKGVERIEVALGETAMLADISMLAIIHRISEIEPDLLDPERVPHVDHWRRQVDARPSAQAVYAQQSDEFPPRPKTKSISGITGPWRYSKDFIH